MSRLVWTETLDGWHSGRYQIELAAPHLWVLTRRPKHCDDSGLNRSEVVRTAGSLRELKGVAGELARGGQRRRGLLTHLALMILLLAIAVVASALEWGLTIPVLVAVFTVALRTLVIWVDGATGGAWSVLSQHYQ